MTEGRKALQGSGLLTEELQTWRQQLIKNVFRASVLFGAIAVVVSAFVTRMPTLRFFYVGIYVAFVLVTFVRPGSFRLQAWSCLGLLYGLGGVALFEDGMKGDGRVFMLALPLLAALLLGQRMGLLSLGLALLTLAAFGVAFSAGLLTIPVEDQLIANDPLTWTSGTAAWLTMAAVTVASLNYMMRHLADALDKSHKLAHELEESRATLEDQVRVRTQALAEQTEALNEMVGEQQGLLDMIHAMSTPVVPLQEGIIVMPLVGTIDAKRAQQVIQGLLAGIEEHKARVALLDITGVPVVDAEVANSLLQATQAARLLGAEPILVGLRPEVAHTIVTLGVDLSGLTTCSNLQQGLERAQRVPLHLKHTPPKSAP